MIKTVIRLKNDMVMAFDEEGDQMPQYQGCYQEVKEKVLENAMAGAVFNHWFGNSLKPVVVKSERW